MPYKKTGSLRKTRGDAKMNRLTPVQAERVFEKSKTCSIEELRKHLGEKYGIQISHPSVSNWLKGKRIEERVSDGVSIARQVAAAIVEAKDGGDVDDVIDVLVRQRAFDALADEKIEPEITVAINKLLIERKRLAIDERKIAMVEKRAKLAEELEEKMKKPMSQGDALAILKEKFGWRIPK